MRAFILVAGAALTLSACGGGADEAAVNNDAMMADNMAMDANMMANDMGGLDANAATNGEAEANMMANDMASNDADTNLANGM